MSKSLLDLSNQMKKLGSSIEKQASQTAKKVAETVLFDLTYKTPVDTSQALSNWQIGLGAPVSASRYLEPYYIGQHGSTRQESAQEAIEVGRAKLANKKPGQSIFISNVAPYIKRLNDGYSQQEPAGFVERAVLIGRNTIKNIKIKLESK